jgi:hypothetical protein
MSNILKDAADYVAAKKLELAARNLARLIKISEEQASLNNIVASLERTIIDAHAGNPDDFSDILAAQTRILDATFHFYINNADCKFTHDDKINIALRAQRQTDRTINTWKRIKTEPRVKKFPERTRQMLVNNAPLDV